MGGKQMRKRHIIVLCSVSITDAHTYTSGMMGKTSSERMLYVFLYRNKSRLGLSEMFSVCSWTFAVDSVQRFPKDVSLFWWLIVRRRCFRSISNFKLKMALGLMSSVSFCESVQTFFFLLFFFHYNKFDSKLWFVCFWMLPSRSLGYVRSLFCSPRLRLFVQKYSKNINILKYYYN